MAEIEKKPVKITETILRDAHQSLIATRMTTEQMLPIVDKMDKVGYHAVECWGGATFDASLRFLHEDPWDRLRKFRDGFKNTKLQMLFRGQNLSLIHISSAMSWPFMKNIPSPRALHPRLSHMWAWYAIRKSTGA